MRRFDTNLNNGAHLLGTVASVTDKLRIAYLIDGLTQQWKIHQNTHKNLFVKVKQGNKLKF